MLSCTPVYLTILLLGCTSAGIVPEQACRLDDSVCFTKEFQNALPTFVEGIPELDVEVLDPMDVFDINFVQSGLHFSLTGATLKGLKGAVIDKVDFGQSSMYHPKLEIAFHFNGTVKGHYKAAGRLLILPISGNGQMKLKFRHLEVKMYIYYTLLGNEVLGDDTYLVPLSYNYDVEVKGNARFNLTNLFQGNKEQSDRMHAFLNKNWHKVSLDFGRSLMEGAAAKIYTNIQKFFAKQPIENLLYHLRSDI